MITYLKIKYQQAINVVDVEKKLEIVTCRDKTTGKVKQKNVDHVTNL